METIDAADPLAVSLVTAIRTGDVEQLAALLEQAPGLATGWLMASNGVGRTPLHVAADWPGYFPNGPAVASLLLASGADPNADLSGDRHSETPLHWAASSDDFDVAVVLLDGGGDATRPGGSINGGTPLDNAVGYGCWHVARLLVERGAPVRLWHAAALGRLADLESVLAADPAPTAEEVNEAFWQACHGGQLRSAEMLLHHGADATAVPGYSDLAPLAIAQSIDTRRELLVAWLRKHVEDT